VAEKWRRCGTCRKILPVEEFTEDEAICIACQNPTVKAAKAPRPSAPATTVTRRVPVGAADLLGRGDPEVRARRARLRAMERLAEGFPEEFAALLAEERRSERL